MQRVVKIQFHDVFCSAFVPNFTRAILFLESARELACCRQCAIRQRIFCGEYLSIKKEINAGKERESGRERDANMTR